MTNKPKTMLGGIGFYLVLAACLVVIGVSGYFILFRGDPAQEVSASGSQEEVVAKAPEIPMDEVEASVSQPLEVPVDAPEQEVEDVVPPDDTPVVAEAPNLIVSPLSGQVVAAFSVDQLQYSETLGDWRTHDGVDIAAAAGTTVLAACAGTVESVYEDDLLGTTVVLSHKGGYQTLYANLQAKPAVKEGDTVSAGGILGAVGSTSIAESAEGPHLHFSVTKDGDAVNPDTFLNS